MVVILVGGLVLFGWAFDLTPLESLVPSLATMKPNTALAFVVAGVLLWLLCYKPTTTKRRLAQAGLGGG